MQNGNDGNECATKGLSLPHEALLDGRLPLRIHGQYLRPPPTARAVCKVILKDLNKNTE